MKNLKQTKQQLRQNLNLKIFYNKRPTMGGWGGVENARGGHKVCRNSLECFRCAALHSASCAVKNNIFAHVCPVKQTRAFGPVLRTDARN